MAARDVIGTNAEDLLILSRADIVRLMDYADYVDAVAAAFRAAIEGRAVAPPASALHVPNGSFHAKGAALLGDDSKVAIKINGNFPGNPAANGLPTVQGVIYLADGANGRPLAVMDSIEVTINRTAAATTLAARHLARADSRVATICGAGVQGRIQLVAIAAAAKLERVHVWDTNQDAAAAFARDMAAALSLDVRASPDLGPVRDSDIVVAVIRLAAVRIIRRVKCSMEKADRKVNKWTGFRCWRRWRRVLPSPLGAICIFVLRKRLRRGGVCKSLKTLKAGMCL